MTTMRTKNNARKKPSRSSCSEGAFLPAKTPADRGKSVNGGRGDGWKDVLRKDVLLRGNGGRSFSQEGLCIAAEPSQFRYASERGQNREISSNLFN